VVEDEPLVALLLEMMLEDADLTARVVTTPYEALDLLMSGEVVNVLVTDINLETDMDGLQLARVARTERPDLKVLYVSGDSGHRWEAEGVPGSRLLPKPFSRDQFHDAVRLTLAV